jgi:8-oxo-dGTP diphosphatase
MRDDQPILAAGGVVLRSGTGPEALLVHRPAYDDWTLPKGKALAEESAERTALREVEEETGVTCRLGPELPTAVYADAGGRPKLVRYWLMALSSERAFVGNEEIDAVEWVASGDALDRLSYARDRQILAHALAFCGPLYLVRHAKAEARDRWSNDALRPLTGKGVAQSQALVDRFDDRRVDRILSSPFERCVATVRPLAEERGMRIEEVSWLAEGASALEAREHLLGLEGAVVACSHGDVIPAVVGVLMDEGISVDGPVDRKKGSTWVVERPAGMPSRLRYEPPPLAPWSG